MKHVPLTRAVAVNGFVRLVDVEGYALTKLFGTYHAGDWQLLHLRSGAVVASRKALHHVASLAEILTADFPDVFRCRTLTGFRRKLRALSPERLAMFQTYILPLRRVG